MICFSLETEVYTCRLLHFSFVFMLGSFLCLCFMGVVFPYVFLCSLFLHDYSIPYTLSIILLVPQTDLPLLLIDW